MNVTLFMWLYHHSDLNKYNNNNNNDNDNNADNIQNGVTDIIKTTKLPFAS